jgi:DNA mismatch repair protein MutS
VADTPMMRQWREAREAHPDALILMRVGDFYEVYGSDAVEAASLLDLALTRRNNGAAGDIEMAGWPCKANEAYLRRIVAAGRKAAILEQVEDPRLAKGLVKRAITEVLTPGVASAILEDDPEAGRSPGSHLIAVVQAAEHVGIAAVDVSTGEVVLTQVRASVFGAALVRFSASEILLPDDAYGTIELPENVPITRRPGWTFAPGEAAESVCRHFRVRDLSGFGLGASEAAAVSALAALIHYLGEVRPGGSRLLTPRLERQDEVMTIDPVTRRCLELTEAMRPDATHATLVRVIDQTRTPMGCRLLHSWLMRPLLDLTAIGARQDAIAVLVGDDALRSRLRSLLASVRDMDRLAIRASAGRATPRELRNLADSLRVLPDLFAEADAPALRAVSGEAAVPDATVALLDRALAETAGGAAGDGQTIRAGYNAELDDLRTARDGAQEFIATLQQRERDATGVARLKIGFNQVFGYYLEVPRAQADQLGPGYERRQTLSNAERFVTPELKEWEARVLGAEERIGILEAELFQSLRQDVGSAATEIQLCAAVVARVDVLAALAECARKRGYCRPQMHDGFALAIVGGRHPVVETMMRHDEFIPNNVEMDEGRRLLIITGPNSGGKSTILRQTGLIQIMAQVGSFVPAESARLPICDRVFTRVGASDSLAAGQSTYMVEATETAAILHAATSRSLVLADEIGRGTSSTDGIATAWATAAYLLERVGAKVLFATHYHELAALAERYDGVVNLSVSVRQHGGELVLLHRLVEGAAGRSYGVEIARLAGFPPAVVAHARTVLAELEKSQRKRAHDLPAEAQAQVDLFSPAGATAHPVIGRLREMDIDRMTPIEAMNALVQMREEARRT